MFNRNGALTTSVINAVWSEGDGNMYINASGEYDAGSGGFDANNNGFDRVLNELFSQYTDQWTSATATLGYSWGAPDATVIGPATGLPAGTSYELTASTSDPAAVSPVTWDWYVDGTQVGSTTVGTFDWATGDAGTTQDITVVMTDVNGIQHTAYTTATACTGSEFSC